MEDLEQEALEREVERLDGLSPADERRTKERLRAREGVLGRALTRYSLGCLVARAYCAA